jgi:predicted O-methyltransferase YrrM
MAKLYHVKGMGPKGPKRAFLAIPTYDSKLHGPCLYSLLQSLPMLEKAGIGYDVFVLGGNCHVDDARNGCVREFLLTDCTELVFIDADVGWRPQDLVTLINHDRDVVAGVYPKKSDDEDFPVHVPPNTDLWSDKDGLVEVFGAPTGFMKIKREVLEKMCKAFEHKQYRGQNKDDPNHDAPYTILFERTFDSGYRLSGDYAFCFKWRFMGGKVHVDPNMVFVHEGLKEWGGCLAEFWRRKYGVEAQEKEAKLDNAVRRLRNGETAIELFDDLIAAWNNPWSATSEFLQTIYKCALNAKGPVLECGSGISTLVLAIASEKTGNRLISMEHEKGWMVDCEKILERFSLNKAPTELTYSPLIADAKGSWYLPPEVGELALVICDGPQRKHGREGLYRIMGGLMQNAIVIADDFDDENEIKHMAEWSQANDRRFEVVGVQRPFGVSMRKAA